MAHFNVVSKMKTVSELTDLKWNQIRKFQIIFPGSDFL